MTVMSSRPKSAVLAVVFDLDGTLIDSMPLVLRAFAHALEPFRPELTEADIFAHLGGPPLRTLLELVGDEAGAGEALRRLEEFGFANGHLVRPFDGMRATLAALHAQGLALAVWTGRDRVTTEAILQAHGLDGFFTAVVCGDDLPNHKPHPGGLLEILRQLVKPADAVLYAGDADADVLGGDEAGVRTILIRHGREVNETILGKAWRVVDSPPEAYALVQSSVVT